MYLFSINWPIRIKRVCRNFLMISGLHVFVCDHEEERRRDSNKPLSTGTPSTHNGIPLGKVLDISAHIPPLLLSETWMIWLFDDSLFLKSVSAPYVSNTRLARHMNALPWALWEASAVFKPGGRIGLWTQTGILRCAKAHRTGFKCMLKETSSYGLLSFLLWINKAA